MKCTHIQKLWSHFRFHQRTWPLSSRPMTWFSSNLLTNLEKKYNLHNLRAVLNLITAVSKTNALIGMLWEEEHDVVINTTRDLRRWRTDINWGKNQKIYFWLLFYLTDSWVIRSQKLIMRLIIYVFSIRFIP